MGVRYAWAGALVLVAVVTVIADWRAAGNAPGIGVELPIPSFPVASPHAEVPSEDGCDLMIGPETASIEGAVAAGDVICLRAGTRGPLDIEGLSGSPEQPIRIVNHGGVTVIEGTPEDYAGIDIRSSTNVVISGAGVESRCGAAAGEQRCGIVVRGVGRGVAATEQSDRIAVDHVEITATTHSGIFMRTAAEAGATRGEWIQRQTVVTDNYIHGVGTEGLYLGSSSYADGVDPLLEGVVVERNLVIDSGWDGIQVGSAVADCVIADNRVVRAGTRNEDDQNAGIINNRGSVCDIVSNVVAGAAAHGVYVQGNGSNLIANNLVVQPGRLAPEEGDGITVARGSNDDRSIAVVHNTVVGATRSCVRFRNDAGDSNQVVANLLVSCERALDVTSEVEVSVDDNLIEGDLERAGFVDPWGSDFRLAPTSPAVDAVAGEDTLMATDLLGIARPQGSGTDAGAFERVGSDD